MTTEHPIGSEERPLRVAVVGSGPSGFYAAGALYKQKELSVEVDMFERLPMPYGLVRGGVAPDHQRIKNVIRAYERTAKKDGFRFFGNVTLGEDVDIEDLRARYDQVVLAVGCPTDRNLKIPGEELENSRSATEFVGWYNGHPDFQDAPFDLSGVRRVVVVGVGNVSMDVTRILVHRAGDLEDTDITDEALAELRESAVEEVVILGRRGPAQAKFSPSEIQEIGGLEHVDLIVPPHSAEVDALSEAWLAEEDDRNKYKNIDYLQERAEAGPSGTAERTVRLEMLASPVEVLGEGGQVSAVRIERNRLTPSDHGAPWPVGTGEHETFEAELLLRAVGYRGVELPGVPFAHRSGTIPNREGRVVDAESDRAFEGVYVVGWAKRGPSGLIGTNRGDAKATVHHMIDDVRGQTAPVDEARTAEGVLTWLEGRGVPFVTFDDWKLLDALEVERGEAKGKVRDKFTRIDEALEALEHARPGA